MAAIEPNRQKNYKVSKSIKKIKRSPLLIDMTPMVDLGFLLITFFIFTTTLSEPKTMNLFLPKEAKNISEETKVKQSGVFTIFIGSQQNLYYYEGMDSSKVKKANFHQIRELILDKKNKTSKNDLVIIIKPTKDAFYKDIVELIDEMNINEITRFTMIDSTDKEYELIKNI